MRFVRAGSASWALHLARALHEGRGPNGGEPHFLSGPFPRHGLGEWRLRLERDWWVVAVSWLSKGVCKQQGTTTTPLDSRTGLRTRQQPQEMCRRCPGNEQTPESSPLYLSCWEKPALLPEMPQHRKVQRRLIDMDLALSVSYDAIVVAGFDATGPPWHGMAWRAPLSVHSMGCTKYQPLRGFVHSTRLYFVASLIISNSVVSVANNCPAGHDPAGEKTRGFPVRACSGIETPSPVAPFAAPPSVASAACRNLALSRAPSGGHLTGRHLATGDAHERSARFFPSFLSTCHELLSDADWYLADAPWIPYGRPGPTSGRREKTLGVTCSPSSPNRAREGRSARGVVAGWWGKTRPGPPYCTVPSAGWDGAPRTSRNMKKLMRELHDG